MAVLAIFSGPAITKAHYESLRKEVGWEVSLPPGGIFHVAGFDERGGIHVADVWDSPQSLDQFVSTRLLPAMKRLNVEPPTVVVFPVHNANTYPAADAFKIPTGKK